MASGNIISGRRPTRKSALASGLTRDGAGGASGGDGGSSSSSSAFCGGTVSMPSNDGDSSDEAELEF
jgi:hypothetical protein